MRFLREFIETAARFTAHDSCTEEMPKNFSHNYFFSGIL
ncbi:hypothetical protein PSP6_230058 [Paraburkholderia tropica]|nr:hypothetical protein PSP6_230058 [Paraburkholderia tropica]